MVRCKTWAKVSVQLQVVCLCALCLPYVWTSVLMLRGEANRFCWKHLGGLPGPLGKSAWRDAPSLAVESCTFIENTRSHLSMRNWGTLYVYAANPHHFLQKMQVISVHWPDSSEVTGRVFEMFSHWSGDPCDGPWTWELPPVMGQ